VEELPARLVDALISMRAAPVADSTGTVYTSLVAKIKAP
jgi:hypothetical protein